MTVTCYFLPSSVSPDTILFLTYLRRAAITCKGLHDDVETLVDVGMAGVSRWCRWPAGPRSCGNRRRVGTPGSPARCDYREPLWLCRGHQPSARARADHRRDAVPLRAGSRHRDDATPIPRPNVLV